jgi:hypothetical protein
MKLIDILKDLTYGELAALNIGNLIPDESENQPDPHQYEMIVGFINLGLKEIYKRFFLKSNEIYIQQHQEISEYVLHSAFAQSNVSSTENPKYIMDTAAKPFEDDILKIEEVYDEAGNKLPLNDTSADAELSQIIFTPTFRTIQISDPSDTKTVAVQYRACHPKVKVPITVTTDPTTVEIELPNSLQEALLYYVGARAWRATDVEKSMAYWQLFKTSCVDVQRLGLEVQGEPGDWRFDDRGWV